MAGKYIRKAIHPGGVKTLAPYSPGIQVNDTLYVSGQIGLDGKTGKVVSGGFEPECRQALENMGTILKAAGSDYKNVVKVTVLLADMGDFATLNKIYSEYFNSDPKPARAAYQVVALPVNARVEIEAIAVVGTITEAS